MVWISGLVCFFIYCRTQLRLEEHLNRLNMIKCYLDETHFAKPPRHFLSSNAFTVILILNDTTANIDNNNSQPQHSPVCFMPQHIYVYDENRKPVVETVRALIIHIYIYIYILVCVCVRVSVSVCVCDGLLCLCLCLCVAKRSKLF